MQIHKVSVASLQQLEEELSNTPPYSIVIMSDVGFTHITRRTEEDRAWKDDPRILIREPSIDSINHILGVIRDRTALAQMPLGYSEQASFYVLGDRQLLANYPDHITLQ